MRSLVLGLFLAGTVAAAPKVTLTAPTHTPKVGVQWVYTVRATEGGKAVAARLTVQIVDPLGHAHPVQYANTKKNLVNWPFRGVFRDFIAWPASVRGIPVTLRVTVHAGKAVKVIRYAVTPHG
jgi:hypothetical protein